jgi:tetratricopeptide (TPR) repeat protein
VNGDEDHWRRFVTVGPRSEGASWTVDQRSAPPPSPAQFARIAEEQGVDVVIDLVHRYRLENPTLVPYEEERMLGFVYAWGPERAAELQRLLELNLELYPQSAQTHFWLAQVHLTTGERDQALASLEAALRIDPGFERARRLISSLEASGD